MDTLFQFVVNALQPLVAVITMVMGYVPSIGTALLLLVLGSWACVWMRIPVDYLFKLCQLDDLAQRMGISTVLYRLGLGASLGHVVRGVLTGVVFLGFFLGAMDALNLPIVGDFLRRTVDFMPVLLGAIIILGGGLFLGELIGRIVHRAADANHVRGADGLMRIAHGLVVIFAGIAALMHLGVDVMLIVNNYMTIVVGAVGLSLAIAFGVAFGLAGRDTAEKWIREMTPTNKPATNGHEPRMKVVR